MKPLSNLQKAALAQMARRAFDHLVARGQLTGIDFNTWRRKECQRAVGKHGLTACGNDDYNPLAARFSSLTGEDGRALNHLLRAESEPRRQAEAVLVAEMQRAGLRPEYVERISQDRFKCAVIDATVPQLHQLIVTIKARAASRRHSPSPPRPTTLA